MLKKMHFTFILCIFFLLSASAKAQLNSATFQKKIYVVAKEVRVDSLLRIFARQTGVEFSFNSNKISPAKKLSVTKHTQSLSDWLTTLNNTLGVQHKVVGNHIILIDVDKPATGKKTAKASNQSTNKKAVAGVATTGAVISKSGESGAPGSAAAKTDEPGMTDSPARTTTENPIPASISATDVVMKDTTQIERLQLLQRPITMLLNPGDLAKPPVDESIHFAVGYSKHGSGDMNGMVFAVEYTKYLSGKFSLTYNIRGSINSSTDKIIVNNGGQSTDASIRFTTAGFQIGVNGGLSLIKSPKHEFMIKLGAFGRYQSASNGSDGYSLYGPTTTGVPTILVGYDNRTPQQTIALGGIFLLQYNFTFNKNLFLGVQPAFQTDTNGDAIPQAALVIGKRF